MNQPSATAAMASCDWSRCFTDRTAILAAHHKIWTAIERAKRKPQTRVRVVNSWVPDQIHWVERTRCKRPAALTNRDDTCRGCGGQTATRTWTRQTPTSPATPWRPLGGSESDYEEILPTTPYTRVPDGAYRIRQGRILRHRDT